MDRRESQSFLDRQYRTAPLFNTSAISVQPTSCLTSSLLTTQILLGMLVDGIGATAISPSTTISNCFVFQYVSHRCTANQFVVVSDTNFTRHARRWSRRESLPYQTAPLFSTSSNRAQPTSCLASSLSARRILLLGMLLDDKIGANVRLSHPASGMKVTLGSYEA